MIDPRTVPHYATPEQIREIGARHAADAKRRGLTPLEAFVARWESPFDGDDISGLIEEVAVAAVAVMCFYNLNASQLARIQTELAARKPLIE